MSLENPEIPDKDELFSENGTPGKHVNIDPLESVTAVDPERRLKRHLEHLESRGAPMRLFPVEEILSAYGYEQWGNDVFKLDKWNDGRFESSYIVPPKTQE